MGGNKSVALVVLAPRIRKTTTASLVVFRFTCLVWLSNIMKKFYAGSLIYEWKEPFARLHASTTPTPWVTSRVIRAHELGHKS